MKSLTRFAGALPFFIAVFLNAFVDLGHKIVIQNTIFKLYDEQWQVVLTAILNGLILLPFIMLFVPAGRLSDRYCRVSVMRASAWLAVGLCAGICLSYYMGWFWLAFGFTFLLAVQSCFYSPAKMGFIKDLFGKARLGEANGVVSSLAIIAILSGTFIFSVFFETLYQPSAQSEQAVLQLIAPIGWLLLITAVVELWMCYRLPKAPTASANHAQTKDALDSGRSEGSLIETASVEADTVKTASVNSSSLAPLLRNRHIRLSAIGLAIFWAIGQVMVAAFPAFFKTQTGIDNTIALQGVLACSGLGIALGAWVAGRMSRDHIELGILPFGALGIALGLMVLPSLDSVSMAALCFFIVGFSGGLFIVPLNALIQFQARDAELGKTLAANNWLQNVAMLSFLIMTAMFAYLDISSKTLLQLIAWVAVIGFAYTLYQLPQSFLRVLLGLVLRRRYKIAVQGVKNIPAEGGALLLGNHVSWIDWAVIQLAVPRPVRFVMIRDIYQRWYLRWFFDLVGCIPIEQGAGSRQAMVRVKEALNQGDLVCLFPEGAISRTGHLGEFRRGYEKICKDIAPDIPIIPFYLHGLWGTLWSRATAQLKQKNRQIGARKLIVALGKPIANSTKHDALKQIVTELSVYSWQKQSHQSESLGRQWVYAAKQQALGHLMSDSNGTAFSSKGALAASSTLACHLRQRLKQQRHVAVALPASTGSALINMALLQLGKTLVNLNFTAGEAALTSALKQADIKTVISSRKLAKKLLLKGIDLAALFASCELIYLEDEAEKISLWHKVKSAFISYVLPCFIAAPLLSCRQSGDDTACILFSSGSEGAPKGVCLSHKNIAANIKQTTEVLNPQENDVMLGNLPPFHAFGLTVTQLLPLLQGIAVVFHPDPTDALNCARLIARNQITVLFGTSTFLRFYNRNRKVDPLMLESLRCVVSGAEKLNQEVKLQFEAKFNKTILEGYGTTETTPVAAVNLPNKLGLQDLKVQLGNKPGSVGMPLPGSCVRIVDPDTYAPLPTGEQGMILIGGVQVMQGYLNQPEKTAQVLREEDGLRWYITGDKGYVDSDSFLYVVDRYSRFAKVAGEMVGLTQVEQALRTLAVERQLWQTPDEAEILVVNVPDDKKGERLVLLATSDVTQLLNAELFSQQGLSNLAMPSRQVLVEAIPKLASGKNDFAQAKRVALSEEA